MKKQNPITVWTFPYRKSYYLTHPHKWFHDLYWNIRNFWHRGRYGYAYVDVWNFCDWYPRVAAEALRYLAKNGKGYPGVKPYDTIDKWTHYLTYLAERLERCANSQDICFHEGLNEYKDELNKIMRERQVRTENPDGSVTISHTLTEEEEEIRKKYWAREEEIRNADMEYNKETWALLAQELPSIWD